MSTRGLYGFRKDGVDKTTYNHYDSYPEGLGFAIAQFCANTSEEEMNRIFDAIVMVREGDEMTEEQAAFCEKHGLSDTGVSTGSRFDWYCALNRAQGKPELLKELVEKEGFAFMLDDCGFIRDSLWCEYAYIINLDTHMLEFWKGFQQSPQMGNRYGRVMKNGYYPCRLVTKIRLRDITSPQDVVEILNKRTKEASLSDRIAEQVNAVWQKLEEEGSDTI